jgi:hypothetical protein
VGLSLVVAGLGGSRSEKRAVGLSGKGGWPWLSAGGGGGKKRKKKKKSHAVPIPAGFQVVVERKEKKNFPRRADPSWWWKEKKKKISHAVPIPAGGFRWWWKEKKKKKKFPRRRADPMVSGGGYNELG